MSRPSPGPLIRRADILLIIALAAAGLALSLGLSFGGAAGEDLVVTAEGQAYGIYPLGEDRTLSIEHGGHRNVVEIRDGSVRMVSSDCPGQDCVRSRQISRSGESILCLPNRLVLEIRGGEEVYDSVSR